MSMYEEVLTVIQQEIDCLGSAIALSPATVAISVQRHFGGGPIEPHVQYTSLEHIKQMARRVLAGRYEPDGDNNESHQGELFSGHLQERYPVPREKDVDPIYKKREMLTAQELDWNIEQLRKSATARMKHADALQAWGDSRGIAA